MKFIIFKDEIVNLKDMRCLHFLGDYIFVYFYENDSDWEIFIEPSQQENFSEFFKEFLIQKEDGYFNFAEFRKKN